MSDPDVQATLSVLAIVLSLAALIVGYLSFKASVQAVKAAIFEQRFSVYRDAEKFLSMWSQKGHPNIDELRLLVDAWNRSHFLFGPNVTAYLREVWLDALNADLAAQTLRNENSGDRKAAAKTSHDMILKHLDEDFPLRRVFAAEMKI